MSDPCIVTGAAGFIGSHLAAALLARGRRVLGLDNFDPFYPRQLKLANLARLADPRFQFIEADIRDNAAMRRVFEAHRPSSLLHLAALPGVRPSLADPARYVSVNVDGLISVLDAARAAACHHVVFASSSSVYGNSAQAPFAETEPADQPISPYAATKRSGELLCHAYSHLFGMNIAALRFFTVFGPAQRPELAISSFMRLMAEDREVPVYGDGSSSRDYTFVDDIISGCMAALDRVEHLPTALRAAAATGTGFFRIWNLGGSQPVTLADLIDQIGQVVGVKPRIRPAPPQPGDVRLTCADLTRSSAELDYAPTVALADGLRRQWEWMRAQFEVAAT